MLAQYQMQVVCGVGERAERLRVTAVVIETFGGKMIDRDARIVDHLPPRALHAQAEREVVAGLRALAAQTGIEAQSAHRRASINHVRALEQRDLRGAPTPR